MSSENHGPDLDFHINAYRERLRKNNYLLREDERTLTAARFEVVNSKYNVVSIATISIEGEMVVISENPPLNLDK